MPEDIKSVEGVVISVQGPVVDVRFKTVQEIPNVYSMVTTKTVDGRQIIMEVAEHRTGNIARCIAINSTLGLQRSTPAFSSNANIEVPGGEDAYARIMNAMGEPIDQKGPIIAKEKFPIRTFRTDSRVHFNTSGRKSFEVIETGIKMIDLLFPLVKGSKTGVLGGAGLGKTIIVLEMIYQMITKHQGTCVFAGVGERIREGNELYYEMHDRGILPRVAVVFGQMNEPPGARFGAAVTGITIAESFQRKNKDVLLFVDNIFRYVQAGAEISTLLGRVPSETGYQPTLMSEVAEFHERIRSSREGGGSITAIEAVYVPADDISDPAVVTIFSFLDSVLVLSRERIQLGLYPAIDPLLSSSSNLDIDIVGRRHFDTAQEVIKTFQKYEELRRTVMVIGIDELSITDRTLYERARKLQNFLTQSFFVAEIYTGKKGHYVTIQETLEGCEKIMGGAVDDRPEDAFYMIGALT